MWGMKGVCLRKRWGKCYMRCIVKFYFLAFFEWKSTFYYFIFEKVHVSDIIHLKKNNLNRAIIYPFRVISKLSICWNKLKKKRNQNECEPIGIITWSFLCVMHLQNEQNIFLHLQRYPDIGCKHFTHQFVWTLNLPPSQKSRYLWTCIFGRPGILGTEVTLWSVHVSTTTTRENR